MAPQLDGTNVITLGGGCFWCTQAIFSQLRGVTGAVSGYAGGRTPNPSYEQVCSGRTGHAEVVQITFEQSVTLHELLEVFFTLHDPTTVNRQGADVGEQYRSVIFYRSPEQKAEAERAIAEVNAAHLWSAPIVTQVVPFQAFYPAEDYHQDYFAHNPDKAYCRLAIAPKVAKLRAHFLERLKV